MAQGGTRKSRRFSWSAVDPAVIRATLGQVYRDHDDREAAKQAAKLSDAAAFATATERLGEPPRAQAFTGDVVEVLRKKWLPVADESVLDDLTRNVRHGLSGDALAEPVGSRTAQIRFLRNRKMTGRLKREFRSAFISAHKTIKYVPVTTSTKQWPVDRISIAGQGSEPRVPYPHQESAIAALHDLLRREGRLRGRLVLPTGSGKTATMVSWVLDELAADPSLRVLWLVHQQELVDQAMLAFIDLAKCQTSGFERSGRCIHSGASALSTLADPDLTVACLTYQSFRKMDSKKRRTLERFLAAPTIVIVDEAHHAGATTYDELLDLIERSSNVRAMIGLTATPFPAGAARARFQRRFPTVIAERTAGELVQSGILARPVVTTVATHEIPEMTAREVAQASRGEIPDEVLGRLNIDRRNQLIVKTWLQSPEKWDKTLMFATRIDHANELATMLNGQGVSARALHSRTPDRGGTLTWFKNAEGPTVLVSVGMLTEGVDLPDAHSAFLARPTTSPILMRQMVGRVLRGPAAGGSDEAEVVHFRDDWQSLPDVLEPSDVLLEAVEAPDSPGVRSWAPGPIVDDDELAIRADLAAQIRRAYDSLGTLFSTDDDDPFNDVPPAVLAASTHVVGYYDLGDTVIPVFSHQADGYRQLLAEHDYSFQGWSFLSHFEDTPPPYPSKRSVAALVDYARNGGEIELVPVAISIGPRAAAKELVESGPMTETERFARIASHYERSANRLAFASVEAFEERVNQDLSRFRDNGRPRLDAESALPRVDQSKLPTLPRANRGLGAATALAVAAIKRLPAQYGDHLQREPTPDWTSRVVESTLAHWSLKPAGKGKGTATIRVNRLLRTTPEHVPDEMLGYLVYHELLHHILPSQGHDAEFRELEAHWPNALDWDLRYDTLDQHWDTRSSSYPSDQEP
jgi:superfamily II DNA or RNA helicase